MVHLITFVTDRFDPAKQTLNDINPIAGQAVLLWLGERLQLPESGPDVDWFIQIHKHRSLKDWMFGRNR